MNKFPYYPSAIALPMHRHYAVFFVIVTLTGNFICVGKRHTYLYFLPPDLHRHFLLLPTAHVMEF